MALLIRLLVADDHGTVREGLDRLFATVPDVVVVGLAADGREAVMLADRTGPNGVLMDVAMPELDGVEATRQIMATHPACKIIMLTAHGDEARIQDALQAGAVGYLLKDTPADDVVRAVQAAHPGPNTGATKGAVLLDQVVETVSVLGPPSWTPQPFRDDSDVVDGPVTNNRGVR